MFIRTESYSVPEQLHAHVFTVLHTVHMPLPVKKFHQPTPLISSHDDVNTPLQVMHQISGSNKIHDTTSSTNMPSTLDTSSPGLVQAGSVTALSGSVTPDALMQAYNVDTFNVLQSPPTGSTAPTNTVFATIGQSFSPNDLVLFQNKFKITVFVPSVTGGHRNGTRICISIASCRTALYNDLNHYYY